MALDSYPRLGMSLLLLSSSERRHLQGKCYLTQSRARERRFCLHDAPRSKSVTRIDESTCCAAIGCERTANVLLERSYSGCAHRRSSSARYSDGPERYRHVCARGVPHRRQRQWQVEANFRLDTTHRVQTVRQGHARAALNGSARVELTATSDGTPLSAAKRGLCDRLLANGPYSVSHSVPAAMSCDPKAPFKCVRHATHSARDYLPSGHVTQR